MSINAVIINALKGFGYPCKPDVYTGSEKKYFTFNYADDRPDDFGDDAPECTVAYMQIHFFIPLKEENSLTDVRYIEEKNKVREALFKAGFTYPVVTMLTEPENNIRHIVYECDIAEEREEE